MSPLQTRAPLASEMEEHHGLFVSRLPVLATLLTTSHKTRERVLYSRLCESGAANICCQISSIVSDTEQNSRPSAVQPGQKYKPGYLVTPRFWMGYRSESTTGNFTKLKSKAYPVAHITVEIPTCCKFSSVNSSC